MELVLGVAADSADERGTISGIAITDRLIVAAGGVADRATLLASSNAARYSPIAAPIAHMRDVLAVGDSLWVCGEAGLLAVSRDRGATWATIDTGTRGCVLSLALAPNGALWMVGEDGFCGRLHGNSVELVDFGTRTRLSRVYAIRDEIITLGHDGAIRRLGDAGSVAIVNPGTTARLTGLVVTPRNTWIVTGDAGFIARSPDGQWYSRVTTTAKVDLEAIAQARDGKLVAVGDRGTILVSSDDGRSWPALKTDVTAHLWCVRRFGGGVLIGADRGGVFKLAPPSDDTWLDRPDVFAAARTLDAIFADGPVGFIARGLGEYIGQLVLPGDGRTVHGTPASFEQAHGVPLPAEARQLVARGDDGAFADFVLDADLRPDVGDRNLFELLVCRDQQEYLGTDLVEAFCGVFHIGSQASGDSYHLEIYEWDGPRQVLHFDREAAAFSGVYADSLDSLVYLSALARARAAGLISTATYTRGIRALDGKVAPRGYDIAEFDADFVELAPKRHDAEFFFYRSRWICALLAHDGVADMGDIPELFQANFNQVVPDDQLAARYEACEKYIPTALYAMWRAYLFDEPELGRYLEIGRNHVARLVRDAAILIGELLGGRKTLGAIDDVPAWLAAFRALDLDPRRDAARAAEATARAAIEAARTHDVVDELSRTPPGGWTDLAWRWLDDGIAHRALLETAATAHGEVIERLDELGDMPDDERAIAVPRLARDLDPMFEAMLVGSLLRDDSLDGVLRRPASIESPHGPAGSVAELDILEDDGVVVPVATVTSSPIPAMPDIDALYGAVRKTVHSARDREIEVGDDEVAAEPAPVPAGIEAIRRALDPIYHGDEPAQMFTGEAPLHAIAVYVRHEPEPHFHLVTYGFTDLFRDPPDALAHKPAATLPPSGYGFELTMRVARDEEDDEAPEWAIEVLQELGRYVFATDHRFAAGDAMELARPVGEPPRIDALAFVDDPELGELFSELGSGRFVQVYGITADEHRAMREWSSAGVTALLARADDSFVTSPYRASVLSEWALAQDVERRIRDEGSDEVGAYVDALDVDLARDRIRIAASVRAATTIGRAMRQRARFGRGYAVRHAERVVTFEIGDVPGYRADAETGEIVVEITKEIAAEIAAALGAPIAGVYRFASWFRLEIEVVPSVIRDAAGRAIEIRGYGDPAVAAIALEAQQRADADAWSHLTSEEDEDDDGSDDDDDDGSEYDDDDDEGDVDDDDESEAEDDEDGVMHTAPPPPLAESAHALAMKREGN